jgi:hypothetical protein
LHVGTRADDHHTMQRLVRARAVAAVVATMAAATAGWGSASATTANDGARGATAAAVDRDRAVLSSDLVQLVAMAGASGGTSQLVAIEVRATDVAVVSETVHRLGGVIGSSSADVVTADIPVVSLGALAAEPTVAAIRSSAPFVPAALAADPIQDALVPIGVAAWQASGLTGAGTTVAIFDFGFEGVDARQADGTLPAGITTRSHCPGGGMGTGTHGTSVAEIIHQVAPGARLTLTCIDTASDVGWATYDAVSWDRADVINLSGGFRGSGRADASATGSPLAQIDTWLAVRDTLFVTSAGNAAQSHWSGVPTDVDHDGVLELDGHERVLVQATPGSRGPTLVWDEWPVATTNLDVYVASPPGSGWSSWSDTVQGTGQWPVERPGFFPAFASTTFEVEIRRVTPEAPLPRVDLWFDRATSMVPGISAGSVELPAAMASTFAVGATCGGVVEPYSSRGPTIDGRREPELVAPTRLATATDGPVAVPCEQGGFAGTSAAAPVAAGIAALLLEAHPHENAAGIAARLRAGAVEVATTPPGPDDDSGAGEIRLGAIPTADPSGYWLLTERGEVLPFGDARRFPRNGGFVGPQSYVDLEPGTDGGGYWVLLSHGLVMGYGRAEPIDCPGAWALPFERFTSLSATPTGRGLWLFTEQGVVVTCGDAAFFGDMSAVALNGPIIDSVITPSGRGYYMVASDGGVFAFGDAAFHGSMGGTPLNEPVMSLVPDGDGQGYWLVASDGGVFAFDAPFLGSMGATPLNQPVTGMVRYADGYLMVGEDGGVFNFSHGPFLGSTGDAPPPHPVVAVAALP